MNVNKNSSNYIGEKTLQSTKKCSDEKAIVKETKSQTASYISETEKKLKRKLAAQKFRANLSEEAKREAKEKNKLAMQQRRANLSESQKQELKDKERSKREQKRKQYSDGEERAVFNQTLHVQQHHQAILCCSSNAQCHRHDDDDDDDDDDDIEDEDEDAIDEDDDDNELILYRERRNAQSRAYKKARYAKLKEAEVLLNSLLKDNTVDSTRRDYDTDIHQLQLLSNRRQQILGHAREYGRTYRQNHPYQNRRWVPLQQTWDEENPCR